MWTAQCNFLCELCLFSPSLKFTKKQKLLDILEETAEIMRKKTPETVRNFEKLSLRWASLVAQLVKNLPAMQDTQVWFLGRASSPGEGTGYPLQYSWASLMAQLVKNPLAMQGTWVLSLSWEDPLEEGMANHSSILAWRIPMDRETWRAIVYRVAKSQTQLSN